MTKGRTKQGSKAAWNGAVPGSGEQFELKRRAVLREAGRAFSRFGFHNVSLEHVAEALNVSKPALYRYFATKQEMLYECHKMALELGEVSVAHARTQGGNGLDHVLNFIRHYVASLGSEVGALAVLSDQFALPSKQLDEIRAKRRDFDHILRDWVTQGVEDGSIRRCDPALAVSCFMGAVNWLPVWYSPDGSKPADEVATAFGDFFASGLSAATQIHQVRHPS